MLALILYCYTTMNLKVFEQCSLCVVPLIEIVNTAGDGAGGWLRII
jgi:hypothetical protein